MAENPTKKKINEQAERGRESAAAAIPSREAIRQNLIRHVSDNQIDAVPRSRSDIQDRVADGMTATRISAREIRANISARRAAPTDRDVKTIGRGELINAPWVGGRQGANQNDAPWVGGESRSQASAWLGGMKRGQNGIPVYETMTAKEYENSIANQIYIESPRGYLKGQSGAQYRAEMQKRHRLERSNMQDKQQHKNNDRGDER